MNWSSHDPRNDINLNKFNQNDLLFDNKNLKLENIFD